MVRPLVALVGRPNVGKSTLFNRIVGQRLAIVEEAAGTTRDRMYARADWGGRDFDVVDTGGLAVGDHGDMSGLVHAQAQLAIGEADVVVLLTDATVGVTSDDDVIATLLRRSGKPVVLAVNKAESVERRIAATEFWRLGLGEPMAISALHGTGTGDLLDAIVDLLPAGEAAVEAEALRVAIVGRPNVGKSSLVNRLLGGDRMIVSEVPGTTRDAVDSALSYLGVPIVLVDTAGIRRRGRIESGLERYSVLRAMRAIERSDVAVLLIDATDGVTAQDAHIGGFIDRAGKGAIVVVNKWDLLTKDEGTARAFEDAARSALKHLDYAPMLFVSALTGQRALQVLAKAIAIDGTRRERIPTSELNRLVADIQAKHNPPSRGGRRLKLFFATQASTAPPTFVFFVNARDLVHFSYERFVENQLRAFQSFEGTPLRLVFRERAERNESRRR